MHDKYAENNGKVIPFLVFTAMEAFSDNDLDRYYQIIRTLRGVTGKKFIDRIAPFTKSYFPDGTFTKIEIKKDDKVIDLLKRNVPDGVSGYFQYRKMCVGRNSSKTNRLMSGFFRRKSVRSM